MTFFRILLTTALTGLAFVGIVLGLRPLLDLIYFWIITTLEPPISDALWLALLAALLLGGPVLLWIGIARLIICFMYKRAK